MEGSIFLGQQYSFVSYDQIERTSQKYRRIEQASQMKVSEVGYVCLKRMRETEIPSFSLASILWYICSRFGQPFFLTFFEGIIKGERK